MNSNEFREYNIYRSYNNSAVNAFAIKGIFSWNNVIAYVDVLNGASGMFCERFAICTASNQEIKRCFSVADTRNNHCQVYFDTGRVVFKTNGHLLAKVVTNDKATISFEESDVDTTGMTQVTF